LSGNPTQKCLKAKTGMLYGKSRQYSSVSLPTGKVTFRAGKSGAIRFSNSAISKVTLI
jgi:hypothetical protein